MGQAKEIDAFKLSDELRIPTGLDFAAALPSISKEETEILTRTQPSTIHAAKQIPGALPILRCYASKSLLIGSSYAYV